MPFFSIIISTYNRADLVVETIESVLEQQFQDFEIVLIDDGSTDQTKEVIRQKYGSNEKVKYYWQENAERGVARNHGLRKAAGKYAIIFDSDDLMLPDCLAVFKKYIDSNQGINFLAAKFKFFLDGKTYRSPIHDLKEGWYDGEMYLKGQVTGIMICLRKDKEGLRYFVEDRAYATLEDWIFLVQNLLNEKIYLIDKVTMLVNDHPGRSMKADNRVIIDKRLLAMNWITENVSLNEKQRKTVEGNSYYFCSIHSYLDADRKAGMNYLKKAIDNIGINTQIIKLYIKILIGRNMIRRLR